MTKCVAIILMYNDAESTANLLENIRNYSCLEKIVVVDNCSSNDSFEKISKLADNHVHVIRTETNGGVAKGNNFGARYAAELVTDVDYFLFSNPDVIVTEDSMIASIEALEKHMELAAVCPMEHTREDEPARDFAWRFPTYWQTVSTVLPICTKLAGKKKNYLWYYDREEALKSELFYADIIISCFIMVRRADYDLIGGFCEKTFLYHEEDIFAHKLYYKAGKRVAVLPQISIVHMGCSSMNKSMKNWEGKSKVMFDSSIIYLQECLGIKRIGIGLYKLMYHWGVFERRCFRRIKRIFGKAE